MHSDVPSHITEGLLQMGSEEVSTLGVTGTAEKTIAIKCMQHRLCLDITVKGADHYIFAYSSPHLSRPCSPFLHHIRD